MAKYKCLRNLGAGLPRLRENQIVAAPGDLPKATAVELEKRGLLERLDPPADPDDQPAPAPRKTSSEPRPAEPQPTDRPPAATADPPTDGGKKPKK
jgi:hypothetical protein